MRKTVWQEVLDRIYPSGLYCICCGKITDETRTYSLCNDCMDAVKWALGRTCSKCGKPLSPNDSREICFNCSEHRHEFDRGFTCAEYGSHERSIVYSLKYDDRPDIAVHIAAMMADRMRAEFGTDGLVARYDLLVPVPVSRHRKKVRGYNQAELISRNFSESTGVPFRGEILQRTRETVAMKGLTPDERRVNIIDSFELKKAALANVRGARCLIVDDIYTTGATIDETARVLKASGALSADFLSFANGADVVK